MIGRLFLFCCALQWVVADEPLVEIQGRFVHATKTQMEQALAAAKARPTATLFSPEQMEVILAKLKEGGAEFFSDPRAVTQSGESATVKAVREVAYPTEFEPSNQDKTKLVPKSFETRNAGVTLEVKANVQPDGRLRLAAHPEFTRFLGFLDYASAKAASGAKPMLDDLLKAPLSEGGVWKPVFATFSVQATFTLANGQTALMGGPMAAEKDGLEFASQTEDVFVFLTASVVSRD